MHILGAYVHIHIKNEVSVMIYGQDSKSKKNTSWLSFKTISQNDEIFNQHISGAYLHTHTKYELYMTIFLSTIANYCKVPK